MRESDASLPAMSQVPNQVSVVSVEPSCRLPSLLVVRLHVSLIDP